MTGLVIWGRDVHIFYSEETEVGRVLLFLCDSRKLKNMRDAVSETADGRKLHCTKRHFVFWLLCS